MSASTTWTCDKCLARVEIPSLGAPAPADWIPVERSVSASAPGAWRDTRESEARIACSPRCAEALAHELVTAAFAAGDVAGLDFSTTRRQPERA
jgi:hypothetical protein